VGKGDGDDIADDIGAKDHGKKQSRDHLFDSKQTSPI
jgi:hypothetical protein